MLTHLVVASPFHARIVLLMCKICLHNAVKIQGDGDGNHVALLAHYEHADAQAALEFIEMTLRGIWYVLHLDIEIPQLLPSTSRSLRRWVRSGRKSVSRRCDACRCKGGYALCGGGGGPFGQPLRYSCKSCLHWLLLVSRPRYDAEVYTPPFECVLVRGRYDAVEVYWIGTLEFVFWLWSGAPWFRATLQPPRTSIDS